LAEHFQTWIKAKTRMSQNYKLFFESRTNEGTCKTKVMTHTYMII